MWNKLGVIFNVDNRNDWMISHACVPTAILINPTTVRIFYSPRNKKGKSIPTYFDVEASKPS